MNSLVANERQVTRVALMEPMLRFVERRGPRHVAQDCICSKHLLNSARCVVSRRQIFKHAAYGIYRFTKFHRPTAILRIPHPPGPCCTILLVNRTVSHLTSRLIQWRTEYVSNKPI